MRFQFFTVPAFDPSAAQDELNRFLDAHRILAVDRQLVSQGTDSCWTLCVSYTADAAPEAKRSLRPDYREILSEPDFRVFAELRDLRKRLAERARVPPYAVFTNEQLAAIVTRRVRSLAALAAIDGVGPSRVEHYGQEILDSLARADQAAQGREHAADGPP